MSEGDNIFFRMYEEEREIDTCCWVSDRVDHCCQCGTGADDELGPPCGDYCCEGDPIDWGEEPPKTGVSYAPH